MLPNLMNIYPIVVFVVPICVNLTALALRIGPTSVRITRRIHPNEVFGPLFVLVLPNIDPNISPNVC